LVGFTFATCGCTFPMWFSFFKYPGNGNGKAKGNGKGATEEGRFAELGWAKEFLTVGSLSRTVTWKIGNIKDSTSIEGGKGETRK
jgi:hypothetical protein